MSGLRGFLLTALIGVALGMSAQTLNVGWKRIADITAYPYEDHRYDYNPFQLFHFYVERPLSSGRRSIGVDIAYASYHPNLPDLYNYLGSNEQFYDRSFSLGLMGRWYGKVDKAISFVEVGVQGNYIFIKQPVVIPTNYGGRYEMIVKDREPEISGTLAVGISVGSESFRWEPYVQLGVISGAPRMRSGRFVASSVGIVKDHVAWVIAPLVLKVSVFAEKPSN